MWKDNIDPSGHPFIADEFLVLNPRDLVACFNVITKAGAD